MTEQFVAGIVGAPFALNGFVKIKPFSGEVEHLLKLRSVILRQDGKERLLNIQESAVSSAFVLMRFTGYDNPEAVRALQGAELLVNREDAAPLHDDEFYVEDLKGLAVCSLSGGEAEKEEILGHITAIVEGGGGDLVEIRLNNGKTRLVPLRKEFFAGIEPEKGKIILKNLWILE